MPDRSAIHAYVTDAALEAWRTFAEDNGVSVTGLLESLGVDLAQELEDADGDATKVRQEWVKAARKVDAVRRRR